MPTDWPVHPALIALLAWSAAMSLATLAAYALDKHRATHARRRTSERTLHTLSLLGGWPGALLAMHLLKHKRRKAAFVRVFWLTVVVHLVAVALIIRLLR